MATNLTAVDLSQLAPPSVVEAFDYETILAAMLADLRARDAAFSALVESDPAYKILEVAAYREMLMRQRVNEAARAVMLAYAQSADLDHLAANFGVLRLLLVEGDPNAQPPTVDVFESDEELRRRLLLSLEAHTTAGSVGSYIFHALSGSGDVLDAAVNSLVPGVVNVAVLSRTGTGAAPQATLDEVTAALNKEEVRPLCDTVEVATAEIISYAIDASLVVYPGTGQAQVLDSAKKAAEAYAAKQHKLGLDVTLSGLYAALHQPGVQKVNLVQPAADVVAAWNQATHCTGVTVTIGGTGE